MNVREAKHNERKVAEVIQTSKNSAAAPIGENFDANDNRKILEEIKPPSRESARKVHKPVFVGFPHDIRSIAAGALCRLAGTFHDALFLAAKQPTKRT